MKFEQKLISPGLLFREVQQRGAATTKELKEHFGVDSASIRKSMAPLFAVDAVWFVTSGRYPFYMVNSGERGRPSPQAARADARAGKYAQPKNSLDFRGEMLKQVLILDQLGWDDTSVEVPNGRLHKGRDEVEEGDALEW